MKMVTIVEAKYIPVKMQLYWFIFSWLLQNLAFWEPMQSNPNITDQIYHSDVTSCLDPLQKWVTLWLFANRYFFYLKKVKSQYSQNYISDCATNYISDSHRICYFLGHILSFKRKKKDTIYSYIGVTFVGFEHSYIGNDDCLHGQGQGEIYNHVKL